MEGQIRLRAGMLFAIVVSLALAGRYSAADEPPPAQPKKEPERCAR